mmetsp:Transcript_11957/g.35945  ORF Transcript_11957/g.35945 Transcript_11957/m.35945 type:complete len:492 (-) Transcript_11957:551-2026(-)
MRVPHVADALAPVRTEDAVVGSFAGVEASVAAADARDVESRFAFVAVRGAHLRAVVVIVADFGLRQNLSDADADLFDAAARTLAFQERTVEKRGRVVLETEPRVQFAGEHRRLETAIHGILDAGLGEEGVDVALFHLLLRREGADARTDVRRQPRDESPFLDGRHVRGVPVVVAFFLRHVFDARVETAVLGGQKVREFLKFRRIAHDVMPRRPRRDLARRPILAGDASSFLHGRRPHLRRREGRRGVRELQDQHGGRLQRVVLRDQPSGDAAVFLVVIIQRLPRRRAQVLDGQAVLVVPRLEDVAVRVPQSIESIHFGVDDGVQVDSHAANPRRLPAHVMQQSPQRVGAVVLQLLQRRRVSRRSPQEMRIFFFLDFRRGEVVFVKRFGEARCHSVQVLSRFLRLPHQRIHGLQLRRRRHRVRLVGRHGEVEGSAERDFRDRFEVGDVVAETMTGGVVPQQDLARVRRVHRGHAASFRSPVDTPDARAGLGR